MKYFIIISILIVQTIGFGQEFTFGRTVVDQFESPFGNKLEDHEYHPNEYRDSTVLLAEDFEYFDTTRFEIKLSKFGLEKFRAFRIGAHHKPIVFAFDGKPIFGAWITRPENSFGCNWLSFVYYPSKRLLKFRLGYGHKFKYAKAKELKYLTDSFVEFFVKNSLVKK